jgi:hypothetical protein
MCVKFAVIKTVKIAKNNQKGSAFDADFDTFWKEALDWVEPATDFFLPELHAVVDWSKDP